MLKMFLISCFSARNPDTLCVPTCLKGEICNEIVGKCICDPTLRDVEWCKARRREYEKFLSGSNIISKSPLHLNNKKYNSDNNNNNDNDNDNDR